MRTLGATGYAALGAGLTAVAFGLARYAFGLFVPSIRGELGLTADVMGIVGSLAFVSFVVASLFAPAVADRLGARHGAMLASALGVTGFVLITSATGAWMLSAGVLACGVCTGLMMPALTAGVQATVRPALHGRVNAVMNAGTSLGLIACGPAVLFLAEAWRETYAGFALLAATGLLVAWLRLPSASRADGGGNVPSGPISRRARIALAGVALFSLAAGFTGAAFWIFAPDLVVNTGGVSAGATGLLWLVIGLAGLAGAWASDLCDRIGGGATLAMALLATAASLVALAAAPDRMWAIVGAAAVFGWAQMTISGLLLVTGVRLVPDRPSVGPVLPFVSIAIGQALGSPVAGWMIERWDHGQAFGIFAALSVAVVLLTPLFPSTGRAGATETPAEQAEREQQADWPDAASAGTAAAQAAQA